MAEPFIAEIRIFAGNFAPRSWAFCNGQLLPISQNTALFSLVGITYGGDGKNTLALPNMQGRAPMHAGRGPGLTPRILGETNGVNTVTLSVVQMPSHNHTAVASSSAANSRQPATPTTKNILGAAIGRGSNIYKAAPTNISQMVSTGFNGGDGAHNNMQPYLTLNFIIALVGLYPQRS